MSKQRSNFTHLSCLEMGISPFFFVFLCLLGHVFSQNVLSAVSYSFVKPNSKNFAYIQRDIPISVSVTISSFAVNGVLALKFWTNDNLSLNLIPTTACYDESSIEVFRMEQNQLLAAKEIATPTTCKYSAKIFCVFPNMVYNKLGTDAAADAFSVPSFTTSGSSFTASWTSRLLKVGEVNTLSMNSDVPFAESDNFVITANNGSPFAATTACIDSSGAALFTVAAHGSRLLFSARDEFPSGFSCKVDVTVAPTMIKDPYYSIFAPNHGLTVSDISGLTVFLDRDAYHVRVGVFGVTAYESLSTNPGNMFYLAIPADAVRTGGKVKLHFDTAHSRDISACKYRNGAAAGSMSHTFEPSRVLSSTMAGVLTLASPLYVSADNFIELLCPLTSPSSGVFQLRAVSVREGVFSSTPINSSSSNLPLRTLFSDVVYATVVSYNQDINSFKIDARMHNFQKYSYVNVDVSLLGVKFSSVADLESKCNTRKGEFYETASGIRMTLTDGQARFQIDAQTLVDNEYRIRLECNFRANVGDSLAVYDNISKRLVSQDVVHAGSVSLVFGDGVQTHWPSADAFYQQHTIPFTVSVNNMYSQSNRKYRNSPRLFFTSGSHNISYPNAGSSLGLNCTTGLMAATTELRSLNIPNRGTSFYSEMLFARHPDTAHCTGKAAITLIKDPYSPLTSAACQMIRCVAEFILYTCQRTCGVNDLT